MRSRPYGQLLAALRVFVVLSVLLGLAYPLAVLGVGQLLFRSSADGSLVRAQGRVVGSSLIGQQFTDPKTGEPLPQYFQSRPSAAGAGDDPTASGASNRGPEDVKDDGSSRTSLLTSVCARSASVARSDGASGARPSCSGSTGDPGAAPAGSVQVPADAVTASGSGLDPDISPAYALLQVDRVAAARGLPVATVRALVEKHVQGRTLGFLGEPRVDVLELDLALDALPGQR